VIPHVDSDGKKGGPFAEDALTYSDIDAMFGA